MVQTYKKRVDLRQELLPRLPAATALAQNRTIDLALRLRLMINFRDREFETLRH